MRYFETADEIYQRAERKSTHLQEMQIILQCMEMEMKQELHQEMMERLEGIENTIKYLEETIIKYNE
ncbi:TPA: hypothetical protein QCP98_006035 [Bacillus cereus]|nr:hypothetical protein [Bacillus cereus]